MERKFLKEKLGLADDIVDQVLAENGKDLDKVEAKLNTANDQITSLQGQLDDRDGQLKDLKKSAGDNEDLKQQIADLQKANEDTKKNLESQLQQTKVDSAINLALSGAKARDAKAVMPFINRDTLKLNEDGSVAGLKEQIDAVKKDKGFLFESDESKPDGKHINVFQQGNPSGGESGDSLVSKIASRLTEK